MQAWQSAVHVVVIAVGLAVAAVPVVAQVQQKFPTKPVRLVVGFSPGSGTDTTARLIAPRLSEIWGQPVVIENRSGAGGQFATVMVAKATPDGHTLLVMSAAMVVNAVLPVKPMYDLLKDFTGVTQIGVTTTALIVTPSLGVKSAKALIALAREFPDVKAPMDAIGFERAPMKPEEHDQLLRRLVGSISKVVVAVGLRAP